MISVSVVHNRYQPTGCSGSLTRDSQFRGSEDRRKERCTESWDFGIAVRGILVSISWFGGIDMYCHYAVARAAKVILMKEPLLKN